MNGGAFLDGGLFWGKKSDYKKKQIPASARHRKLFRELQELLQHLLIPQERFGEFAGVSLEHFEEKDVFFSKKCLKKRNST